MNKILLIEDDESFGYILSEYLTMKNFNVTWVKDGEKALKQIDESQYDLAILDIMLPGMDGFEVAKRIKSQYLQLPFIFLSAKSMRIEKLKGYQYGAFDYITKPIDEELVVAKINAIINLTQKKGQALEQNTQIGKYLFNPRINQLSIGSKIYKLTNTENDLLVLLVKNQNSLLLRDDALKKLWGEKTEFTRKSMDVFISKLRKYLEDDSTIKISNIHGKGFVFSF